jgi:hypothetical protein
MSYYIQDIQRAKDLLEDPKATYVQLLDQLCELERFYGELKKLIKMGLGLKEDMITLWKIRKVADKIKFKIKHRVKELAKKYNEKYN